MSACQRNLLRDFVALSKLDGLFAHIGAIAQGDEALSRPDSAILGSLALVLAPTLTPTLLPLLPPPTNEMFKQFIQTYINTV